MEVAPEGADHLLEHEPTTNEHSSPLWKDAPCANEKEDPPGRSFAQTLSVAFRSTATSKMFPTLLAGTGIRACLSASGCIAMFGIFYYMYRQMAKFLCGDDSCWYTLWCCTRMRLAMGVDKFEDVTLKVRVHTVAGVTKGQYFLAFIPCTKGRGRDRKPVVDKKNVHLRSTGVSVDQKWEEEVEIHIPQGFAELQVCLFQPSAIPGRRPTCVGWRSLKVEEVLKNGPYADRECALLAENKTPAGKVFLDIEWKFPDDPDAYVPSRSRTQKSAGHTTSRDTMRSTRADRKTAKGRETVGTVGSFADEQTYLATHTEESEEPLTLQEQLAECASLLSGPLEITDAYGEYHLKWFQVKHKASRDVWSWEWYSDRNPEEGTKPEGRIPFRSIQGISAVDKSISEFALKYKNAQDRVVTMIIQRHDRPRDAWLRDLHRMIRTLREVRRARRTTHSSSPEPDVTDRGYRTS